MSDRRYNAGKWIARVVAAAPPLALLVCIVVYLLALKAEILAGLPPIVASAASAALHRQVRIGGISGASSLTHIVLRDVAVSDAATFAAGHGRTAASAQQVDIDLAASALLRDPANAASYISLIRVTKPYAYIERLPNRKFNFSNLFISKRNPKAKPFRARIVVIDGTLVYRDRLAPPALQPAVNRVAGVNGYVDFGAPLTVIFRGSGFGLPGRAGAVNAFGTVVRVPTSTPGATRVAGYDVHVDASRASAPYFTHYFLSGLTSRYADVAAGTADVSLTVSQRYTVGGGPIGLIGSARVSGGKIVVRNRGIVAAPVEGVAGRVLFTNTSVALSANATVSGMPVGVTGNVPQFRSPFAAFRVNAPRVDAMRLHGALPFIPSAPPWLALKSSLSVVASAIGPLNALQYSASFSTPSAAVDGIHLTGVRGGIRYRNRLLNIDSLIAGVSGGVDNVQFHGSSIAGSRNSTVLRGHLSGVDLAKVSWPGELSRGVGRISGILDADVDISSARRLPVGMTARIRNASVRGIPIQEAVASFSASNSFARVSRLELIQPDGATVSVAGDLPLGASSSEPYRLNVVAAGADIGELARGFGRPGVSGSAYFRGVVTGSAGHPEAAGRLSMFDAGYRGYDIDHLTADIEATSRRLSVANGVASRLGVTTRVAGSITGVASRAPAIQAKISTSRAELAGLGEVVEQALAANGSKLGARHNWLSSMTGSLDAAAQISGPLSNLSVNVGATVSSGSVAGVDVSQVSIKARYADSVLTLDHASGTIAGADVAGAGSIDVETRAIQAHLDASATDLSNAARLSGIAEPLSGSAAMSVTAGGTLDSPTLFLNGSVKDFVYRNIQVDSPEVVLQYADGIVTNGSTPIVLTSGPATYTVSSLRYDSRQRTLALLGSLSGERVARLMAMARGIGGSRVRVLLGKLPPGLDGALTVGEFDMAGPIASPAVHAVATIDGITLGEVNQEHLSMAVNAGYSGGKLTVTSLEGRGRKEYVSASGTYTPDGPLDARLDASDIPLSLFQPFVRRGAPLGGQISDLTVIATGTSAKPVLNASLSLSGVALGSVSLDRIDSGRITVADDRIDIAGVTFVKSEPVPGGPPIEHVATIRGSIPFVFSLKNGLTASFPANAPVSLTAQLPDQSVSLISLFAPALGTETIGGTIAAALTIGGTLNDKVIQGSLDVKDGSISAPGLKTAFRDINIDAIFSGARGTITSSRMESSAGGFVTLSGSIAASPRSQARTVSSALDALLGNLQVDLALHASDFTVSEPKIAALYNAGFQGTFNGDVAVTRGLLTPLVSGSLQVANAVGNLPRVASNKAPPPVAPAFNPEFNLAVAIQQGGKLHSTQLDASADGKFLLAGSLFRPNITGDLIIRNGRFTFPTAIFRIVPTGTVHFVYNPPNDAVEQVSITATTQITVSPAMLAANPIGVGSQQPFSYQPRMMLPGSGGLPQRYTVTLTIDGDLNSQYGPSLTFQSNPPGLTNSDILAALGGQQALNTLLVGGNVQLALQTEAQQILTSYAIPTLLQPVESGIASAFGVEEFNVNYEPQSPLSISVTKQIGPRMDVSYTRYVNSREGGAVSSTLEPLEYTLAVNYYFTNQFRIGASTNDIHDNEVDIGGTFRF